MRAAAARARPLPQATRFHAGADPAPHHRDQGWVGGLRRAPPLPGQWPLRPAERGASTAAATEPAAELVSVGTPVAASAFAAAAVIDACSGARA